MFWFKLEYYKDGATAVEVCARKVERTDSAGRLKGQGGEKVRGETGSTQNLDSSNCCPALEAPTDPTGKKH